MSSQQIHGALDQRMNPSDTEQAASRAMTETTPFFVVGAQRSGTTLLRLMLNHHPRLIVPFESAFIPVFHARLTDYGNLSDPGNVTRLVLDIAAHPFVKRGQLLPSPEAILARSPCSFREIVEAIFEELAAADGKVRWGDKTPNYVLHLHVLCELWPECRVVHVVRDGRDVISSVRKLSWGTRNFMSAALEWRFKTLLGHRAGLMLRDRYHLVHYEDLVTNPTRTLRAVCDFLGEVYHPALAEYHRDAATQMPQESLQWHSSSISQLDPAKVFAWRKAMSRPDQEVFDVLAGDALEVFGYERIRSRSVFARLRRFYYALTF